MKIAIVNNMPGTVAILRLVLSTVADYQIIWTVGNGLEAIAKCSQDLPDLILMGLSLPVMDGLEATRRIMTNSPCGILMVITDAEQNRTKSYTAIEQGALDVIYLKADGSHTLGYLQQGDSSIRTEILTKVARASRLLKSSKNHLKVKPAESTPHTGVRSRILSNVPLIVIGSSTGGPKALAAILSELPRTFGGSIVIVQHIDAQFSGGLIDWLNQQSSLPVRSAMTGGHIEKGIVFVANSNDHLYLRPDLTLNYTKDPKDYPYRPSVDVFFKSVAQNWNHPGTAILLTGMGRDGAEGLCALRLRGWHTIAQDKNSSVVYGMPKAAIELNGAVDVLPLERIASTLVQQLTKWA